MENVVSLMDEGRIKRYFRARNKLYFENAIAHITQHASGAEPLFLEEADYLYMLHLLKETCRKFSFNVFAFALMPNHLHLLLIFLEANMPESMKWLFEKYAKYFNKKYERKGHVFCSAYRSALCFDDSYLLASSLYIHNNPVKAGLVMDPIDYRWSSCALYCSEVVKNTFLEYKFILRVLDENIAKATMKYKDLLDKFRNAKINNALEQPDVLEVMAKMLKRNNKEWVIEHGLSGDSDLDIKIQELKEKGKLRNPQQIGARRFMIGQLISRSFSISEIAGKLGISRQSVYNYLNNFRAT